MTHRHTDKETKRHTVSYKRGRTRLREKQGQSDIIQRHKIKSTQRQPCKETHRHTDKETHRHINKETYKQRDIQTYRQRDKETHSEL